MELIRKLPPKRNIKGKLEYLGVFLCSFCLLEVIRQIVHGKTQKSCGCKKTELIGKANKGKKRTEAQNRRNSEIHKGKKLSEEHKQKIRESEIGKIVSEETRQKQSEAQKERFKNEKSPMYGKKHTEESKNKNSESRKGQCVRENNPNWNGGTSFLPYPKEFKQIKQFILERDNNQCQYPGCTEIHDRLHVHHIDYDKNNNNPENLITLGTSCHIKTNGKRVYWKEFYQNIMIGKIMECLL